MLLLLFNLIIEKVARVVPARQEMEILRKHTVLEYADNIVIDVLRQSQTADDPIETAKLVDLKVNQEKTKFMIFSRGRRSIADPIVGGCTF